MPTAQPRFVRKDTRVYAFSSCLCCGSSHGIAKGEARACPTTTCKACGTVQCMVNGLGSGQCAVCYRGLLDGWHATTTCTYKGCDKPAVARGRGRKPICHAHLDRQQPGWLLEAMTRRADHFHLTSAIEVSLL